MAISTVHVLHGIANGASLISQITNARPMTDLQTLVAQSAGLPFPLFTAVLGINPAIPFDTTQVKTILDTSGALTSIADLSASNTDLYFKQVSDHGRRVADATTGHIRLRMSQAFLVLDRITASHQREAAASCRIGTTYDGTNNPLVPAGSVALSGTPTSAEHFVAGPVALNGVPLPGVADITIEFNRQVLEVASDGEIYNTFAACMYYAPVVTIRGYHTAWATYGLNGTALSEMAVYLRKVAANGTRVADGVAQHIGFSASSGLITIDESSGGNNEPAMTTVRVTLASADATSEPISVSTATAIT